MAHQDNPQFIGSTFKAAADLSSHQYKVVYQSAAGQVNLASTAGGPFVGILDNSPQAVTGATCRVVIGGVTQGMAGAAISAGAKVTNNTSGLLVAASDDDYVLGEAVEAATASGDIITVLVNQTGKGDQPLLLADSGSGITAKTLVKLDTSGDILTATDGDISVGVAPSAIAGSATGGVVTSGTTLLTAGETITQGDLIAPYSTTGRAKVATDSDHAVGIALTGAAADSDITVLLLPISRNPSLTLTDSGAGVTLKTFVKLNTSGEMLTATDGDQALGVVTETVAGSATGHVQTRGLALVTAGETIVAGDLIAPFSTTGRAGKVDTMGVAMGIAITGGAAAADITVMLLPLGVPDYIILPAAADYTASNKVAIDINTSAQAVAVASAGAKFIGFLMNQPDVGEDALVRIGRVASAHTGAAVTMGDQLSVDATGEVITAVSGTYAGAIALETDGVGDTEIEVLIVSGIPAAGAWHPVSFSRAGVLGGATIAEDCEVPIAMTLQRAYAKVGTAPGAGKSTIIDIGAAAAAVTISGTDTKAENEAIAQAFAANTDFDVVVTDDGVGADLHVLCWFQETVAAQ